MPASILLLSIGTRGDIQPYLALGRTLAARGHRVTLGAPASVQPEAEARGLGFFALAEDLGALMHGEAARLLVRRRPLDLARLPFVIHRTAKARFAEIAARVFAGFAGTDLVVYHPLLPFVPDIAAALGVPAVLAAPQPVTPTRAFPLCAIGGRDLGPLNRASYRLIDLERRLVGRTVAGAVADAGGPRIVSGSGRPVMVLGAYSPALVPSPADWPETVHVTGEWTEPPPKPWRPSRPFAAFLAAGPAPIYVGLGSMPWNARRNGALLVEALRHWGGRAVVGRGAGGIDASALPATLYSVGHVPHAQFLPMVAGVMHHGGAGTTAAGLRAARPTLITPILLDQFFWAKRVEALGAGPPSTPLGRLDAPRLAALFDRLVGDPAFRTAAAGVAGAMAADGGVERAADLVEQARLGS